MDMNLFKICPLNITRKVGMIGGAAVGERAGVAECKERGEKSRGQAWVVGLLSGCRGRPCKSFGGVFLTYADL